MVARAVPGGKLDMTWTGPHTVTSTVNSFVYKVRPCVPDQGNRRPMRVHVVRMRRFSNAPLGTPADAAAIEKAAMHDYPDNVVQRFLDRRVERGVLQLRVRWLGFDRTHDTWEPIGTLAEDVPELVQGYLAGNSVDARCARALRRYFPA